MSFNSIIHGEETYHIALFTVAVTFLTALIKNLTTISGLNLLTILWIGRKNIGTRGGVVPISIFLFPINLTRLLSNLISTPAPLQSFHLCHGCRPGRLVKEELANLRVPDGKESRTDAGTYYYKQWLCRYGTNLSTGGRISLPRYWEISSGPGAAKTLKTTRDESCLTHAPIAVADHQYAKKWVQDKKGSTSSLMGNVMCLLTVTGVTHFSQPSMKVHCLLRSRTAGCWTTNGLD